MFESQDIGPSRIRHTRIKRSGFARRLPIFVLIALPMTLSLTACSTVGTPPALTAQAGAARTAEQHVAVAGRYREYAAHLRAEAARHAELATQWSRREAAPVGNEASGQLDEARHCRELAEYLSRGAAEADAIAQAQEALGEGAGNDDGHSR